VSVAPAVRPQQSASYDAAIVRFAAGIEQLGRGDFAAAQATFEEVARSTRHEPELSQRARTYATICERRLASPPSEPSTMDERYSRAVFFANCGELERALQLLDQSLLEDPTATRLLYARSTVWALKGIPARAVADLRQAIAADPKIRYQAANDSDFDKIREEPGFIDAIEPTPKSA
jgi:tetratricopeptide (TPR) repeat protein